MCVKAYCKCPPTTTRTVQLHSCTAKTACHPCLAPLQQQQLCPELRAECCCFVAIQRLKESLSLLLPASVVVVVSKPAKELLPLLSCPGHHLLRVEAVEAVPPPPSPPLPLPPSSPSPSSDSITTTSTSTVPSQLLSLHGWL